MTLQLTPFKQEHPHTCLPACIRMVLAYWGRDYAESELAQVCGAIPVWGTLPSDAVEGLTSLGYHALWFEYATLERLLALLAQSWPVITFLRASDLPHGRAGLHAIVLEGIEADKAVYVDPALGTELRMPLADFLTAWSALDNQGMVIWL